MVKFSELAKKSVTWQLASELPETFVGRIKQVRLETREGRWGEYQTLLIDVLILAPEEYANKTTRISLPKSTWGELASIMEQLGIESGEMMINEVFTFKRMKIGRVVNPRHVPVEVLTVVEEEEKPPPKPKKPTRKRKRKTRQKSTGDLVI